MDLKSYLFTSLKGLGYGTLGLAMLIIGFIMVFRMPLKDDIPYIIIRGGMGLILFLGGIIVIGYTHHIGKELR